MTITIAEYKKGVLVTGETYEHRDALREMGGKWNSSLRGWVFGRKKLDVLRAWKTGLGSKRKVEQKPTPPRAEEQKRKQKTEKDRGEEGKNITPRTLCSYYLTHRLTRPEIERRWQRVRAAVDLPEHLMRGGKFISDGDVDRMFHAIDDEFFDGAFRSVGWVRFVLSPKKSRGAAKTEQAKVHLVTFFTPVFRRLFVSESDRFYVVGGVKCSSRLECLLQTLAHELLHVLLNACGTRDQQSHGTRFRTLAHHIFGHSDVGHALVPEAANQTLGYDIEID